MIQYLGDVLDEFPGPANQTQCFVHTVNLIAKSILKPFDIRKMKDIREFNDVAQALADLAEDQDLEDEEEGIEDEDEEFDASPQVGPIRLMLLKVCLDLIDDPPKL